MNISYWLFLIHFVGDYYLQSDWMALNKHKSTPVCLLHVLVYTTCFWPLCSWQALLIIGGMHFLEDRFQLVKYFIWARNHLNAKLSYPSWSKCSVTGFYDCGLQPDIGSQARPFHITVMLYIVHDNSFHLICNEIAHNLYPV